MYFIPFEFAMGFSVFRFTNGLNLRTLNVGFVWFFFFIWFSYQLSWRKKVGDDIWRRLKTWEYFGLRENSKKLLFDYMFLLAAVCGTCFQLPFWRQTNLMVEMVWTNIGVHETLSHKWVVSIIPDLTDRKGWAFISGWPMHGVYIELTEGWHLQMQNPNKLVEETEEQFGVH